MRKGLLLSALAAATFSASAQFTEKYEFLSMNPAVGVSIGTTNYFGELNRIDEFSAAKSSTFGANLFYMHPLSPSLFGKATLNYNRISHWGLDSNEVRNFNTRMMGADVGIFYRLDNDLIFDQQKSLTVFVGGGVGYSGFKVKEDVLSENNESYYYWSDGTIRNASESDTNASRIFRDYDYETDVATTKSAFPYLYLEGGFGLKLTHNLIANLSYKHAFTFTDELDGTDSDSKKDRFDFFSVSLGWSFGTPYRTADEIWRDKEAETIDESDMDEDGVADISDLCAKTPRGWEVDVQGCPLDGDNDKVPDAIDKELTSAPGATVDADGITLSEEEIEVMYLLQTGQMVGHERFDEWKAKYPKMFEKYYGTSSKKQTQGEDE